MASVFRRVNFRPERADLLRLASSFILAVLLWGWVTNSQDPQRERTFVNIPLVVAELPAPLQVVGTLPDVAVTVTGPRSEVEPLTLSDINARLKLDGITTAGSFTVSIEVDRPDGIWKAEASPSRIPIQVEEIVSKIMVIHPELVGEVGSASLATASVAGVSEITVVGPRSSVERVADVVAEVQLENQSRGFTTAVSPQAVDSDGQVIPEVSLSPDFVTVMVDIDARGKRVAVLTQIEGSPAQGYEVTDRTLIPDTVLIDGPADALEPLISVATEPVDVSGATETLSRRVQIVGLPEGVEVIDPPGGLVDVVVQIRQQGVRQPLPPQEVTIVGLEDGLSAAVTPGLVEVTVVASDSDLAALTADVISIQVNVRGLGPGTYSLTPLIALPPNVTWVASNPSEVTVTITAAPTAGTPASSPSPGT